MTVEIALIPDGRAQIPQELMSDEVVETYLQKLDVSKKTPIDSWRDIERITYGDGSKLVLRVDGVTLSDVPDQLLDKTYKLITTEATGVKPHPNGWHNVERNEPR